MFQDVYWKYFRDKCTVYIDIKRSYVLLKKVCCVNKKVCCVNKKNVLHRNCFTCYATKLCGPQKFIL